VPRNRLLWPLDAVVDLGRDWLARFVAVQGIDRSMAIAAYAYSALIPLLVVYSSVISRGDSSRFGDTLVRRFGLSDGAAVSVHEAFAPAGAVESGVTALSVALLLVSALSFTRGLQRLYELAFGLPTRGIRNTKWGLLWIAVVCLLTIVRPWVLGGLDGALETVGSLVVSLALWLVTPYMLLGRRVRWLRLLPGATLSALGMAGIGIWSVIWMPHTISSSASHYGVIGVGFALLTWLFVVAVVIVVATTGGAMIADRIDRLRA
jgi:membrane protein